MKLNFTILFCLFFISFFRLSGQKEANNWYFGSYAAVDFNSGSPVALTNSQMSTLEGCASISSAAGQLLFYTDGVKVWDRTHQVMPNGNGLKGHFSASQSAVVIPRPGSSTQYIIFTVDQTGGANGVMYSELDMALNVGKGDIVSSQKNIALMNPACEKITAVKHSNETDFWILCHKFGSDEIYAYQVNSLGVVTTPVISKTGITILSDNPINSLGYMKASANGTKIAYANGGDLKFTCVADLNTTTGKVTNAFSFSIPSASPYGVEYSPDGRLLYVTYNNKSIRQYDALAANATAMLASEVIITTVGGTLGALQLGPDNQMYVASFSGFLSVIHSPNTKGTGCNYEQKFLDLKGNSCSYGLPSFIQSYFSPKSFTVQNICLFDQTKFILSSDKDLDSLRWFFDDPASGTKNTSTAFTNVFHTYSGPGIYKPKLITYFKNGKSDSAIVVIEIKRIKPFIGRDTAFCGHFSYTITPEKDYYQYLWNNGATTKTVSTNTAGTFILNVTDTNGCKGADTMLISSTSTQLSFTVNKDSQCYNEQNFIFTNSSAGLTQFEWLIDGLKYNGSPLTLTKKLNAGQLYTAMLISKSGCSDTLKKNIRVWPSPVPSFRGDTLCFPNPVQFRNYSSISIGSIINHQWNFQNNGSSTDITPLKSFSAPGYYATTLTVTSDRNCSAALFKDSSAFLKPKPTAGFTYDSLPSGDPREKNLQFNNTSSSDVIGWYWNLGNGTYSNISNPTGKYYDTVAYTILLRVTNAHGCTDSTTAMLLPNFYLFLPNVFTPGNDLLNDFYTPVTLSYVKEYTMQIYSRWGELLFETKKAGEGWDGTAGHKPCPEGTYLCVVSVKPHDGIARIYKTTVTLLR